MINNQIIEVESKVIAETQKIKEMIGLVEPQAEAKKKKSAKKKEEPKEEKEPKKEAYDGGPEDLAAMAKSSNTLRNKPETKELAKKAAEQAKSKDEVVSIAVKLAKTKGITDSEQITHIIDLAASMFKNK
jgi:hypothetical protein